MTMLHRRKSTCASPRWPGGVHFPGVLDHGMHDTKISRQPGRPHARFHGWERVPTIVKGRRDLSRTGSRIVL